MTIVGGYTLHLYCDSTKHEPWQRGHPPAFIELYHPNRLGSCFRDARKLGWKIDRARGVALCPKCAGTTKLTEIAEPR